MFPVIQIGPLAVQAAGLFVLASIWIGMTLTEKRAAHSGLNSASLDNLILFALLGFLTGGRLSFTLQNWDSFRASPLDIFSLNTALFDLAGGLAAGLIVALVYGQRKGLAFWSTLDALTPFFATVMIGLGASHLASGEAFGKPTSLPWGIELFGAVRHPSQVYEIAAALFILSLIGLRKPFSVAGSQFLAFAAWTAGARLFLEAFRGDSTLVFGGLRLGQILAWIVLAVAFFGFERLQSERKNTEIQV
jgi:phosphatidylglycerol---prolipoprotein diacylglyceryl transferase